MIRTNSEFEPLSMISVYSILALVLA